MGHRFITTSANSFYARSLWCWRGHLRIASSAGSSGTGKGEYEGECWLRKLKKTEKIGFGKRPTIFSPSVWRFTSYLMCQVRSISRWATWFRAVLSSFVNARPAWITTALRARV